MRYNQGVRYTQESISKMNMTEVNEAIANESWSRQFTMNLLCDHRENLKKEML
jgi:hypothetical protein